MGRWMATLTIFAGGILLVSLAAGEGKGAPAQTPPVLQKATFAGGCFWCMEPPFDKLAGVVSTTSGYTGGRVKDPTYQQVSAGGTGHTEAVEVLYDPSKVDYEKLLDVFWRNVDPTTSAGQFCDQGSQYRPAIFFHTAEQKRMAEASKTALEHSKKIPGPIQVEITPVSAFYNAEDYHQDFYQKNPVRYKFYRYNCGRDQRLKDLWGEAQ